MNENFREGFEKIAYRASVGSHTRKGMRKFLREYSSIHPELKGKARKIRKAVMKKNKDIVTAGDLDKKYLKDIQQKVNKKQGKAIAEEAFYSMI